MQLRLQVVWSASPEQETDLHVARDTCPGHVWRLPGVRHPGPVLGRDEDGGEADREVAPLQAAAPPPPALHAQRVGRVAALALQVH